MEETKFDTIPIFLEKYREFDRRFPLSRKTERATLFFGISGAGKSAFSARLKSGMEVEEFMKELPVPQKDNRVESKEIEGVRVGATARSTTIIPQKLNIRERAFIDMPGLCDSDPIRRVIISVLFKCFASRVEKINFYVIINLRELRDQKNTILKEHYHRELKDLCGKEYSNRLSQMIFIFTHGDEYKETTESVRHKMMNAASELNLGGTELEFVSFLLHVARKHIVVDYSKMNGDDILEMLKEIERRNSEDDLANIVLDKTRFNVAEEKLDRICIILIKEIDAEFRVSSEKFRLFREEQQKIVAEYMKKMRKQMTVIEEQSATVEQHKNLVKKAKQNEDKLRKKRERIEILIADGVKTCENITNIFDMLSKELRDLRTMKRICVSSVESKGGVLGLLNKNVVRNCFLRQQQPMGDYFVIVLKRRRSREVYRKFIEENLTAQKVSEIRKKYEKFIAHSHEDILLLGKNVQKGFFVNERSNFQDGVHLDMGYFEAFDAFIFYESVGAKNTTESIIQFLREKKHDLEGNIQRMRNDLEENKKAVLENIEDLNKYRISMAKSKAVIMQTSRDFADTKSRLGETFKSLKQLTSGKHRKFLSEFKKNKRVKELLEVQRIMRMNQLITKMEGVFKELMNKFEKEEQLFKRFEHSIDASKVNADEMKFKTTGDNRDLYSHGLKRTMQDDMDVEEDEGEEDVELYV